MVAKEGYPTIAACVVSSIAVFIVAFISGWTWTYGVSLVLLLLAFFCVYFFRDPERTVPGDLEAGAVLAPADGKVVAVVAEEEGEYMGTDAIRISIFLSPLNVHVNRVPVGGTIEYTEYRSGSYLAAWNPDAGVRNEQSLIGLRCQTGEKILFKQIAGALARRVVYNLKVGDQVERGARFGIVKFGSRMDVFLPRGSFLHVSEGDRVTAGETHIATLNN